MHFLATATVIFSYSCYCFTAEGKRLSLVKFLQSIKTLVLCCFMTDKKIDSCQSKVSAGVLLQKREQNAMSQLVSIERSSKVSWKPCPPNFPK